MDWKKICQGIGWTVVVLGVLGSIAMAYTNGIVENRYYTERSMFMTLLWFVVGLFSTALSATLFLGMAEILEKLENMNSDVYTVKRAVTEMKSDSDDQKKLEIGEAWRCSRCGKVNMNHTGVCGCGQSKSQSISAQSGQ